MATPTNINGGGGSPQVTVKGTNLVRYRCKFNLWKPEGQVWPENNKRKKRIHDVTFNQDHPPTDTFSLGPADQLRDLTLTWDIDMIVPGGGGPLQYSVTVDIAQDGNAAMNPGWRDTGQITNVKAAGDFTKLQVAP